MPVESRGGGRFESALEPGQVQQRIEQNNLLQTGRGQCGQPAVDRRGAQDVGAGAAVPGQ